MDQYTPHLKTKLGSTKDDIAELYFNVFVNLKMIFCANIPQYKTLLSTDFSFLFDSLESSKAFWLRADTSHNFHLLRIFAEFPDSFLRLFGLLYELSDPKSPHTDIQSLRPPNYLPNYLLSKLRDKILSFYLTAIDNQFQFQLGK